MKRMCSVGLRQWLLFSLGLIVQPLDGSALAAPPLDTLHYFSGGSDGGPPLYTALVEVDGALYGTTSKGGANGTGTVFKITMHGMLTTLHAFDAVSVATTNADGAWPQSGLVRGKDGALYGTTLSGGANGNGTVYRITTSGDFRTLHTFSASGKTNTDGTSPFAHLILGNDGALYGTASGGGVGRGGTVFRITASGVLTTLYAFKLGTANTAESTNAEGNKPVAGLICAKDGNLYGTTQAGGIAGKGTIFKLTTTGEFTTLHFFTGGDGTAPDSGLVQGTDGDIYGTAAVGGRTTLRGDAGTVFKITTAGVFTLLHQFGVSDGAVPEASLIQDKDGAFYGTTLAGPDRGTVFRITPSGHLTTLHRFSFYDGDSPFDLIQGRDGNLYGTTATVGSVFKLTMTPIIADLSPTLGAVVPSVTLTGANFTEATAVKVGKVSARFTIHSDTSLTLVVPTRAKSAKITVVNPFGTGTSGKVFKVTP